MSWAQIVAKNLPKKEEELPPPIKKLEETPQSSKITTPKVKKESNLITKANSRVNSRVKEVPPKTTSSVKEAPPETTSSVKEATPRFKKKKVPPPEVIKPTPQLKVAPSGSYLIDIGSNLTSPKFNNILDKIIQRARQAGVKKQVITGCNVKESFQAQKLASKYPGEFYSTAGIHPHQAKEYSKENLEILKNLLSEPEVVAVGETGLDFFRNISPPKVQIESFKAHLELAIELKKPLFLHQRNAHEEFMEVFDQVMNKKKLGWNDLPPVVVHCFTGTAKDLTDYIQAGFYIGITGFIGINGRGDKLRRFLAYKVPLDKLMIETDAPYMKPSNAPRLPSGQNEPCHLPYVAEIIAPLYGISEEELAKITTQNAEKFFQI